MGITENERIIRGVKVFLGIWLAFNMAACAKRQYPTTSVPTTFLSAPYRIHSGDLLEVKFEYHPQDNRQVIVGTDGRAQLPSTGEIYVSGMTLPEAEELIARRSSQFLREPVVSITIVESRSRVYVGGHVSNPGFVTLLKPMTALQAIVERGGFLPTADMEEVVVLSHSAGAPVVRRLDLKNELKAGRLDGMVLHADEMVLVPPTGVATANLWVDQWINGMIPDIVERSLRFGTIDIIK